jgi:hypothetical protein
VKYDRPFKLSTGTSCYEQKIYNKEKMSPFPFNYYCPFKGRLQRKLAYVKTTIYSLTEKGAQKAWQQKKNYTFPLTRGGGGGF